MPGDGDKPNYEMEFTSQAKRSTHHFPPHAMTRADTEPQFTSENSTGNCEFNCSPKTKLGLGGGGEAGCLFLAHPSPPAVQISLADWTTPARSIQDGIMQAAKYSLIIRFVKVQGAEGIYLG